MGGGAGEGPGGARVVRDDQVRVQHLPEHVRAGEDGGDSGHQRGQGEQAGGGGEPNVPDTQFNEAKADAYQGEYCV